MKTLNRQLKDYLNDGRPFEAISIEESKYGTKANVHRRFKLDLIEGFSNTVLLTLHTIIEGDGFFKETIAKIKFHKNGINLLAALLETFQTNCP